MWLLNSCAVKTPSEESFNGLVRAAQAANKPIVVAGCVPQGTPRGPMVAGLSMVRATVAVAAAVAAGGRDGGGHR